MSAPGADTIVALSSGRLPAAIAVVRISGPAAFEVAARLAGPLPAPREARVRLLRDPADGSAIDEALTLVFPAPDTATGENIVEFQCHGSVAVVRKLLDVMTSFPDCRLAEPGEFTRQALVNGRLDLSAAEGLGDLLAAETESQRRSALRIARGGLRDELERLRDRLVDLSARIEAAIDYVGDEDETGGQDAVIVAEVDAIRRNISTLLARPSVEPLREGIRVVLAGPTNAGKSSLVNRLAGSARAIVSDIPGTTRDIVETPLAIGGVPFVLVDTAGLRETDDHIEIIGIERARASLAEADILLWLGDPAQAPDHKRVLLVQTRADQEVPNGRNVLAVSNVTGQGIEVLVRRLLAIAETIVPSGDEVGLTNWQATMLKEALASLVSSADIAIVANGVRDARWAVGRIMGEGQLDDVLDRLFSRFCLGK